VNVVVVKRYITLQTSDVMW